MKKIILAALLVVVFSIIGIYIAIPSQIKINKVIVLNTTLGSASKKILTENGWKNWFKNEEKALSLEKNNITFNEFKYLSINDGLITINNGSTQLKSHITLTSLLVDTIALHWSCNIETSNNPLKKWMRYMEAKKIKQTLDEVTTDFKKYIENFKQVYGFATRKTILMDSSMIAIKASVSNYPTLQDIYNKIEMLEKYAAENKATATNFPMLNILKTDSNSYHFMVALPINKLLNNKGEIVFKQMLPKGNFIATDSIYGGFKKVDCLFSSFLEMKNDYQLMSPAIPFQSLVTDRRKESDSTKWITTFYYPIF